MKRKILLLLLIPLLGGCEFLNLDPKDPVGEREGVATLNVYSFNDYHGAITGDLKLEVLGSFIKEKTADNKNIVLDIGDTWQGSIESNWNKGKCITDVFNEAHLTARVIGNHDFDWGQETLRLRTADSYNNYTTPVLGANVYDYNFDTKTIGNTHQTSLCQEYLICTGDKGLKVGIIGTIGSDQITSICTQMVQNVHFTDHLETTKRLSDYLRKEEKCDVIIGACHSGINTMKENNRYVLSEISPQTHKKYCDLVLLGHTHSDTHKVINGVLYSESSSRGQMMTLTTLKYDFATGTLSYDNPTYSTYQGSSLSNQISGVDSTINNIVNQYKQECSAIADENIKTKVSGNWYSSEQLPNLLCESIYYTAKEYLTKKSSQYADLLGYSYCNLARSSLYSSSWTYGDIYKAFPFDNEVYIMKVTGERMFNEVKLYNNIFRMDKSAIEYSGTYYVAVIDYLALHCNDSREYDYFRNCEIIDVVKKEDNSTYTYRDILCDYLKATDQNETIYASTYSNNNKHFDRDLMDREITSW